MADLTNDLLDASAPRSQGRDLTDEAQIGKSLGRDLTDEAQLTPTAPKAGLLTPLTDTLTKFAPAIARGVSPAAAAGQQASDFLHQDIKASEAEGTTPLLSSEGVKTLGKVVGTTVSNLGRTVQGMSERPQSPYETPTREDYTKVRALIDSGMPVAEAYSLVFKETLARADARQLQIAEENQAEMQAAQGERPSEALRHGSGVVSSATQSAAGILAGLATKNLPIGLAVSTVPQYATSYEQSRLEGSNHDRATLSAGLQAIPEAGFELWPLGKLLQEVGADDFVKMATKFVLREEVTELPTTLTQKIIQQAVDTPDKPLEQFQSELIQELKDTAIQTPFAAALGGGVARLASPRRKPVEVEPLMQDLAKAAEVGDMAQVEVLHNKIMDSLEEINKETIPADFLEKSTFMESEVSPAELEAISTIIEPLSDEDLAQHLKTLPPPTIPSELINDGSSLQGTEELPDAQLGQTKKAMRNYLKYSDETADQTPLLNLTLTQGPSIVKGQTLGAVKLQPGTVYGVGAESDSFAPDAAEVVTETYQKLSELFGVNSPIVLRFGQTKDRQAIGSMHRLRSGEFVINPAEMRNFSAEDLEKLQADTYNKHTRAKILDNIGHEFAHVLMVEKFGNAVDSATKLQFLQEQRTGKISEQTIAQFSPTEQALMLEYNQFRTDILKMNAAEFQLKWMSPALAVQRQYIKDFKHAYPGMNATSFVRAVVGRNNKTIRHLDAELRKPQTPEVRQALTAQKTALIDSLANDYLSFNEFLAEQMPRYIYDKGILNDTRAMDDRYFGLGVQYVKGEEVLRQSGIRQGMAEIVKSLRKLFIALKQGLTLSNGQTYRIKAGTSFEDWVEGLSRQAQALGTPVSKAEIVGKTKKQKAVSTMPTEPPGEAVKAIKKSVTYGHFSPKEKTELYALIRQNALIETQDRMVAMLQNRMKMQVNLEDSVENVAFSGLTEEQLANPAIREAAWKIWVREGFNAPQFKAFFRKSKVVDAKGNPLRLFHATSRVFSFFAFGDIGFHGGDLMAAHARMYKIAPADIRNENLRVFSIMTNMNNAIYRGRIAAKSSGKPNTVWKNDLIERKNAEEKENRNFHVDWNLMPIYMRIENPLKISESGATKMWNSPAFMANKLLAEGIITSEEHQAIWDAADTFMQEYRIKLPNGTERALTANDLGSEGAIYFRGEMFEPLRAMLEAKGYDGIQYDNFVEGGTSWVAFRPEQIKSTMNKGTFGNVPEVSYQLDIDHQNPASLEIDTLSRTLALYENKQNPISVALRQLARTQWYVLQLQQLAWIHPEFHFLDLANDTAMLYTAQKSRLQMQGEEVAQKWKTLGKETDRKLSRALEAERDDGGHWTELEIVNKQYVHTVTEKTLEKLKAFGLDIATPSGRKAIEIYKQSKDVLMQQLLAAQISLVSRLYQNHANNPVQRDILVNNLRKEFKILRETPFLPRGDYGQWGLVLKSGTNIIHRQMFESQSDLVKARTQLEKVLKPGEEVQTIHKFPDENRALLALPLEYVENAAEALDLTEEQKEILLQLLHPVKTDKLTLAYAKSLEKLSGSSQDRMRNFADFVWHNSTMIARTDAIPAFTRAKAAAKALELEVNRADMSGYAKQMLLDDIAKAQLFLEKTVGYMLSPPNEWYTVRSAIALIYLMASPKTALVNLTGIMTTYSQLSSQYGELAGGAAFTQAHKQLLALESVGESDELVTQLYNKALKEGFLIQSYAAHLAGAATAGVSKRLINRSRWTADTNAGLAWMAEKGMLPFTLAEQYTRRITFLAQVNAIKADTESRGLTAYPENIYNEAVRQTDLLQNSYSLANRPVIMRRNKSIGAIAPLITIFMSWMEHFTFHAAGGYALGARRRASLGLITPSASYISHTQRILVILFLLGGYEALPGAENLLDILDALFLHWKQKPLRQSIRETIQELPEVEQARWLNNPRWWGKGLGGDIFGFDVSGSISDGRLIPGTDMLGKDYTSAREFFGEALPKVAGVAGSLVNWAVQTSIDLRNGNDLTRNFTKFPGELGALASANEWSKNGVRGPQGNLIYQPSTKDIIGKALNFTPTALSDIQEESWAKRQVVDYWTSRKTLLQKHYNAARDADDREALADVEKAIDAFNGQVIDPQMRLRPFQLHSSYRQHVKDARKLELGIDPKRVRNLGQSVEASFADGAGQEE